MFLCAFSFHPALQNNNDDESQSHAARLRQRHTEELDEDEDADTSTATATRDDIVDIPAGRDMATPVMPTIAVSALKGSPLVGQSPLPVASKSNIINQNNTSSIKMAQRRNI